MKEGRGGKRRREEGTMRRKVEGGRNNEEEGATMRVKKWKSFDKNEK